MSETEQEAHGGDGEAGEGGIRFTKWLIFTVMFALGPLLANVFAAQTQQLFSWSAVIGRGELLVIAAAITGDGLGRVWGRRAVNGIYGTVVFGALAFILLATCMEFGWISRDLAIQADRSEGALEAIIKGAGSAMPMDRIKETAMNGRAAQTISAYQIRDSLIVFGAAVVVAGAALALED